MGYLDEVKESLLKGSAVTQAANHLFNINPEGEKLSIKNSTLYHHLVAKLLYLCKHTRSKIQLAVSFLKTRITSPDIDDWMKLGRCIKYLKNNKHIPLTLQTNSMNIILGWVDASFAVHPNYCSHT